jgi:dTDP-4-amino-4,6-dideoxygalactose transaminase
VNKVEAIPFLDLVSPHLDLEDELVAVFRDALKTGKFIGGSAVEEFERDYAHFCQARYCIGVGSGTDALRFALIAAGVKQGGMVITAPNTFIATTEAISQAGASIDYVDIDERTYNMDTAKLRDYLETKCKTDMKSGSTVNTASGKPIAAVIPVHLYGQMTDMDSIMELAEKYHLLVIEDACQAHGAEYFSQKEDCWRKAGSVGHVAAFSFYPGKNLGACGEAGAVTTSNEEIAGKVRMLRDHGQAKKYYHEIEGYNGRLDAIQAGILGVKLKNLPEWNEKRRKSALLYNDMLVSLDGIMPPHEPEWSRAVYHLYVIRTKHRDSLRTFLAQHHITTGLHYPVPLHLQKAYANMGYKNGDFSVTEKVAHEILSLPMYPGMTAEQQCYVVEKIREGTETLKS